MDVTSVHKPYQSIERRVTQKKSSSPIKMEKVGL